MVNRNKVKFFIRVGAGNQPILGSVVARSKMPSGGTWVDISTCISRCCDYVAPQLNSPANFAATADSSPTTAIDLAWLAVTGATAYKVERSTSAAFTTGLTTVYNSTGTNVVASGLITATTYYFRITAVGDATHENSAFAYARRATS